MTPTDRETNRSNYDEPGVAVHPRERLEPTLAEMFVLGMPVVVALVEIRTDHVSPRIGEVMHKYAIRRLRRLLDGAGMGLVFEHDPGCFAVVLPGPDVWSSVRAIERLRVRFGGVITPSSGGPDIVAGIAVGGRDTDPGTLMEAAIGALVRAKLWGGDGLVRADVSTWGQCDWPHVDAQGRLAANESAYQVLRSA